VQSNLHLSKKLERIPLRRGHTSLQPLFRSSTTPTLHCSRLVEARRQNQSNMSKQMELAPLRRGHLILQQAQLKKEAGRPQAASVRVGSAAGQLLRWKSPINNQLCRLLARPRTIWITQRTGWLSPPARCESQPRHRLYQHWRYNQHPQRCPRLYESIRSQDTTSSGRWISLHFTCGTSTST
jgi:hypothetical protein